MKSSLRKLRGFALQRHEQRVDRHRDHSTAAKLADDLLAAAQDMADMRSCYDNLLSVAAAIANSSYEFSEALQEMGTCLLKRVAPNKDGINDEVLLSLGKSQFELRKLLDSYRVHVLNTITTPSLSLLNELQTVEEMKRQCDEKRELFEFMLNAQKEKGRSKNAKGDTVASDQLKQAQQDYQDAATLFLFRLKSLKQGQFRSLFTQAARHHTAQLNLFRKGVKSLEAVEPDVRPVAKQQHINLDHQFSALEEDYSVEDENDDDYNGSHDGELSFDYGESKEATGAGHASRSPTEESFDRSKGEYSSFPGEGHRPVSQSEPLFPEKKVDTAERIKELRRSATRKLNTYVLPTPNDVQATSQVVAGNPTSGSPVESKGAFHSSPLNPSTNMGDLRDNKLPSPTRLSNAQSVLKESNTNTAETRTVLPAGDLALPGYYDLKTSDNKKAKRGSFSGPIPPRSRSTENIDVASAAPRHSSAHQPTNHVRVSPSTSPPPVSSPKIKELHELPRPPPSASKNTAFPSLVAHSAPLVPHSAPFPPRGQDHFNFRARQTPPSAPQTASPLPTPPGPISRSFSIPSRGMRTSGISDGKETEDLQDEGAARMSLSSLPSAQTFLVHYEDRRPLSAAAESVSKT